MFARTSVEGRTGESSFPPRLSICWNASIAAGTMPRLMRYAGILVIRLRKPTPKVSARQIGIALLATVFLAGSCRTMTYEPNTTSLKAPEAAPIAATALSAVSSATGAPTPPESMDAGITSPSPLVGPHPMVRVALIGDQGLGARSEAVLDLIRDASADFAVVLGDFDYLDRPRAWLEQMARLGKVPWFAVADNHDLAQWPQYQRAIADRQASIEGAECRGTPGTQSVCTLRGVTLVLSGIGTIGDEREHELFIKDALKSSKDRWKLCLWHKNQHDMQVGAKTDEVGWGAYKLCQASGAIIATGHEHSYARTRTLTALGDAVRGHGAIGISNELEVRPGRTFVVVSGLGGVETRVFVPSHARDSWWGAYFTANRQNANGTLTEVNHENDGGGALFLDFGIDGDVKRGRGRFVTTFDRRVFDDFSVQFQ